MNRDIDEVFRGINKQAERSTSIMENLEEKHSQTTSRFQTLEEKLLACQNSSSNTDSSEIQSQIDQLKLDFSNLDKLQTTQSSQSKIVTNHIKNFEEHLNYITNHLDRLELNQKQSSPINETLPNRPNTSFGKSTHLEETSSDSPPIQQSSTPLNGANRRMFPMPENISFNSNSSSKNTRNKFSRIFSPDGPMNIHLFLKSFEIFYQNDTDEDLKIKILNCLNDTTMATIMSAVNDRNTSYQDIKNILIKTYGSPEQLEDDKANFMSISIGKDESLRAFGRRFVVEAKSLSKLCSLTPRDLASALAHAIKPFPHLNIFRSKLIGPIDSETVLRIAETLSTYKSLGETYSRKPAKVYNVNFEIESEEGDVFYSKPTVKGVCHYCGKEGHWMRMCPKRKKDPANEKQNPDICFVDSENSEEDIPKKA